MGAVLQGRLLLLLRGKRGSWGDICTGAKDQPVAAGYGGWGEDAGWLVSQVSRQELERERSPERNQTFARVFYFYKSDGTRMHYRHAKALPPKK